MVSSFALLATTSFSTTFSIGCCSASFCINCSFCSISLLTSASFVDACCGSICCIPGNNAVTVSDIIPFISSAPMPCCTNPNPPCDVPPCPILLPAPAFPPIIRINIICISSSRRLASSSRRIYSSWRFLSSISALLRSYSSLNSSAYINVLLYLLLAIIINTILNTAKHINTTAIAVQPAVATPKNAPA